MSVDYAWPLSEANATTVRDLTVPSVSSLPLSLSVKVLQSRFHRRGVSSPHMNLFYHVNKFEIRSLNLNFGVCPHTDIHTYIHTRFALQSASVGLAQARPNQTRDIITVPHTVQSR